MGNGVDRSVIKKFCDCTGKLTRGEAIFGKKVE